MKELNEKEIQYPSNDGKGHITNLSMVKELKEIDINNTEEINQSIKKDWIFICVQSNQKILLGRV